MDYKHIVSSLDDSMILDDHDDNRLSAVQKNKIFNKKFFHKYRVLLFGLLLVLLICFIVVFAIFIHRNRCCQTLNSTQSSQCRQMNGPNKNMTGSGCERFTRIDEWDHPHNDMMHTVVKDYETCCSMCWHQTSCMAFAYSPTSKDCWIKTKLSDDGGYSHSDRISGYLKECVHGLRLDSWDYSGNNIFDGVMNGSIPASNWQTCCGLCIREPFCHAYTFSHITHQCWLKTKASKGNLDSTKISGKMDH